MSDGAEDQHGSRPIPDPTYLTTSQLQREIRQLQDLVDTRLNGILATYVEKFGAVEQRFALAEQQRVEQKKDTKDAVDAALTAQKEAVKEQTTAQQLATAKSETATTKQLEQLLATFNTATDGLRRAIDDVKERISEVDSRVGRAESGDKGADSRQALLVGYVIAVVTIVVAIVAVVVYAVHK